MMESFDGLDRLSLNFPPDGERMPGCVNDYCKRWFESMVQRSVYYARIAELTGCEMYCLDSEIDHIIQYNEHWKEVIRRVREVYSGPVTSCHTVPAVDFENVLKDKNHWFYDLDVLSLSHYIPAATEGGLSAEEMAQNMIGERDKLHRISDMYGKPILLGECGCPTVFGAARVPYDYKMPGPYDENEQANYLEAIMRTFADEPWWLGMYWWLWAEHSKRPWVVDPTLDKRGFTVRGKKAQQVMKKWYTKLSSRQNV